MFGQGRPASRNTLPMDEPMAGSIPLPSNALVIQLAIEWNRGASGTLPIRVTSTAEQSNPNEAADDPGEPDPPNPYPCPCCGGRMIVVETFGRAGPSPSRIRIDTS